MKKQKKHLLIADFLGLAALVLADQFTKYIAVIHLKDQPAIPIINNVLELNYLENRGAAFGMLQNQKIFFVFVAILILTVIGYVLCKTPEKKKYTILHVLLVMIASGALGNMIDRLRFEYVVDFISFVLINFPIFNVADIYVTVATIILVILLLFVYKEDDLNFISFKQKKFREVK
ncbi:MAG: signal peptidase II [Lachnospiraceae bacterium]